MADEDEEKKSRTVVSLISVAVVLMVGLPVWWNTTKVYRAALPYEDLRNLRDIEWKVKIGLTVIFDQQLKSGEERFVEVLTNKLNASQIDGLIKIHFNINVRESNAEEKQLLSSSDNKLDDLDDKLQELWQPDIRYVDYKFIVLSQHAELSKLSHYAQCFVGKYQHAIVLYDEDENHLADVISNVTKYIFVQQQVIDDSYARMKSNTTKENSIEQMRHLKSVAGFHLSFSLINDEPETGILNWNIQDAITEVLQPFIDKMRYFDISVDSQILHYSGVHINPKRDGDINYLTSEDLPHMINPIEGKLGSFVSLNPSLNFIVFVPPRKQTPLKIRDVDGGYSSTNAFLSPRWGGVLIHNLYDRSDATNSSTPKIITLDMNAIMKVFLMQIRMLVGIKAVSPPNGVIISSVLKSGARDWEYDNLLLAKSMEYLSSSLKTLASLTQLMDKVKNMIIDDNMKTEIVNALLYCGQCGLFLQEGRVLEGFLSAKVAIKASEKAFYDPSVLELLYFPDDQKFAIYIPLFLPMSIPLVLSLVAAIKWLIKKDKSEDGIERDKQNDNSKENEKGIQKDKKSEGDDAMDENKDDKDSEKIQSGTGQ